MSVTSGFFNSLNGDRRYNAEQMSAIFDGVINDGVFANIGTAFTVNADSEFTVNVGIGRAWFNSIWVYNDAILPVTFDIPEVLLNRIDAVVIEIDKSDGVRAGSIKIVKGTPSSDPQRPTLTRNDYINQYPLAYVLVETGVTAITQGKITSMIGTSSCPYITGILQVQNIDNIVAQWGAQWVEWYAAKTALGDEEMAEMLSQWHQWYSNTTEANELQIAQWTTQMKTDFLAWFDEIQAILEPDVAAALAGRITKVESHFDTLAKYRCVYTEIEDSSGLVINDSYSGSIEGKTVFLAGGNSVNPETIGYDNTNSGLPAHTVQGALDELAVRTMKKITGTALSSEWLGNPLTNVVQFAGLPPGADCIVGLSDTATKEQRSVARSAMISPIAQDIGEITFVADGQPPTVDLPVVVMYFGGA